MIENTEKARRFKLAQVRGPVTVKFDGQVAGVVYPGPRTRDLREHVFGADAVVTDDAVRTPGDLALVHVPWAAVIAVYLEDEGALYIHDTDADARRVNHGRHLRLVREVA